MSKTDREIKALSIIETGTPQDIFDWILVDFHAVKHTHAFQLLTHRMSRTLDTIDVQSCEIAALEKRVKELKELSCDVTGCIMRPAVIKFDPNKPPKRGCAPPPEKYIPLCTCDKCEGVDPLSCGHYPDDYCECEEKTENERDEQ